MLTPYVDDKTQIQALDQVQSILPRRPGTRPGPATPTSTTSPRACMSRSMSRPGRWAGRGTPSAERSNLGSFCPTRASIQTWNDDPKPYIRSRRPRRSPTAPSTTVEELKTQDARRFNAFGVFSRGERHAMNYAVKGFQWGFGLDVGQLGSPVRTD